MRMTMELADRIVSLLDESGATEVEKLAAIDIAKYLVPLSRGCTASEASRQHSESEPAQPEDS